MKHPEKHNVDYIVVVTASAETQRRRVLSRPGMTIEKFTSILSKQVPDEIQKKNAHYIINTDFPGYCEAKSQLARIIEDIVEKNIDKWNAWINFERIPHFFIGNVNNNVNNIDGDRNNDDKANLNNTTENLTSNSISKLREKFDLVLFDIDDLFLPITHPLQDEAHDEQIKYLTSNVRDQSQVEIITEHLNTEIQRYINHFISLI